MRCIFGAFAGPKGKLMQNRSTSMKRIAYAFLALATGPMALPAQTLTTLHTFDGTDGSIPGAPLVDRRWGFLRDNFEWRGERLRHGLQNHTGRLADDDIQFLLPKAGARTAVNPTDWSRPPMGTSMGQRGAAGPTTTAQSSKSPPLGR